jgi:hypothetical protein
MDSVIGRLLVIAFYGGVGASYRISTSNEEAIAIRDDLACDVENASCAPTYLRQPFLGKE